jgi:uncharacterized protein (TIGR03437 family)
VKGGPINATNGGVTATFSPSTYTPGSPVTVTVRVTDAVNKLFGFQMTARKESNLATDQAGRFSYTPGVTGVLCAVADPSGVPRTLNGNCPVSGPLEFMEHVTPSSSGTWSFTWTPPATAVGPVHFYAAGNAVNNNGNSDGGDHIYTTEAIVQPTATCVTDTPAITAVISAGAFGARNDFSPGSWIEVYGTNFSTTSRSWTESDFNGSTAPTSLDRVKVTINGQDGFVGYVSPTQVNVQAPQTAGTGPMTITVTNCDKTSGPTSLNQVSAAPGLLAPPQAPFLVSGKQMLAALNSAGGFVGIPTAPVKPGDTIVTYGVGFGTTSPAVAPGQIAPSQPLPQITPVITLGGVQLTSAQILYAGMAPGYVGLYQFNLVVPSVPDGDQPLTVKVGNASLAQTLYLSVKR